MAKDQEKKLAKESYIHHNKSDEEIAHKYKVSLRTAQRWIKEGNWKKLRDSKANGSEQRIERTQLVVDSLTDKRMQIIEDEKNVREKLESIEGLENDIIKDQRKSLREEQEFLRASAASIDDAISKWNKRIENLNKEGKLTLSLYMEVMERIFEALRLSNEPLYMQTLDFQENHLEDVASKLF